MNAGIFTNHCRIGPTNITGDPYLLETLQPFCDEAARERNTAAGTLQAAVENEVQKLLAAREGEQASGGAGLGDQ
jgi:hypothetical protein